MFAFALWDKKGRTLILVRDRMGEKPLYYGWQGNAFLFGSELKSLRAHPSWRGEIDRDALALYMRYSYVPAPYSIYRGIYKLQPGMLIKLTVGSRQSAVGMLPEPESYWQAKNVVEAGLQDPLRCSDSEAVDQLDALLRNPIREKMITDVPLGAFLSGGVDSSTVAALMQAESSRPVKTFSIGFHETGYNEAPYAAAVAKHLGTEHTELYVTPKQAMDVIPRLSSIYDEPFADSSQIPTFLVSEMTRRHVTVALSGDGGDELFGGYNRYFMGRSIWRKVGWLPLSVRRIFSHALKIPTPEQWEKTAGIFSPLLKRYGATGTFGGKFSKLADVLAMPDPDALYLRLASVWPNPGEALVTGKERKICATDGTQWPNLSNYTQRMMFLDQISYLPDDILCKVDRAAMAVSLETRVPFLDHRVVEFAWRVPFAMKIRHGQGKRLLRQVLYRYIPRPLIERPKMGFGVPVDAWLRGPLRDWAEELLDESRLIREGYFQPNPIRQKWAEHLAGKQNWSNHLWSILMFQMWKEG